MALLLRSRAKLGRQLLLLALFVLIVESPVVSAGTAVDPKDDPNNPLRYIPNNTLTAIAFALVFSTALVQTFMTIKKGGQFMLAMVLAEYAFAFGLATRFNLHYNPDSRGIFIAEDLLVVLSPCGFIAANYVLLGRMSRWMNCDEYLLIPAKKITWVFVVSDLFTFLVQATGGSISVSNKPSTAQLGSHIIFAGLILQLISFVLFSILYTRFIIMVYKREPKIWFIDSENHHLRTGSGKKWWKDWRSLAAALGLSCVGILIRSIYRTVEFSQGYHGPLATSEVTFYTLDTLPLFIAISVYTFFWPGRFIRGPEAMGRRGEVEAQVYIPMGSVGDNGSSRQ